MNGPEFLVFYFVVSTLTLLFVRSRIKHQESQWRAPEFKLTDPYEIAFLRGAQTEVLRVSVISLINRGFLEVSGKTLKTKDNFAQDDARRPIEKAILRKFSSAGKSFEMWQDITLEEACREYKTSLSKLRLIASDSVCQGRRPIVWLGFLIPGGLAGVKIFLALQRGQHDKILWLIFLA